MEIGDVKQLFLDDYIVESLEGASRVLNQPTKHPGNPVLPMVPEGEALWEAGMVTSFGSVIFDEEESIFKMWYSLCEPGLGDETSVLAYVTSEDGVNWRKPSLGIFEYRGTRATNITMDREGIGCGIFKDPREKDPARRYKMLFSDASIQISAAYSADGLHWSRYNQGKSVICGGHDSQAIAYWDEQLGKYAAILRDRTGKITDVRSQLVTDPEAREGWRKLWDPQRNRAPENHSIRRVGQAESDDFVHWTPVRCVLGPDSDDPPNQDQFYNMEVLPYEGLRIGLMTVFSYDPDYCRGAVQLAYSRDGMRWHRAGDRKVFVPLSDRPGDLDWGSIYPVQSPLVVGDEIWIYYTAHGLDHNNKSAPGTTGFPNGIALAKLRLDGFVSVNVGAEGGSVTTRPFTCRGKPLIINADAGSGNVATEALDADGKPIEGFTREDCDALMADEIRHTVTWKGKPVLSALEGRTIRLKFHLRQARLFSFAFGD